MSTSQKLIEELNQRSRDVFQCVVEAYLEHGLPVGSRTLADNLSENISAATVRNVLQDLEKAGLLGSPHVSAGRVPTQQGLRLFVDGVLEMGALSAGDRAQIDASVQDQNMLGPALDRISGALSVLTQGASLVLAPKHEAPIKHVEFVHLAQDRALVVLVFTDGHVENRVFSPPVGQTPSSLREAANFINSLAEGRSVQQLREIVAHEIKNRRQEIDKLARSLVESGLAVWDDRPGDGAEERLIVRGRANLLDMQNEAEDLERIKVLFDDLERKRDIAQFLELTEAGDGVRIFIGSENRLFSLSGSALVISPYMNAEHKIIGAVGVIGPKRLNYGRIVPIVDYTAQLVGKLMGGAVLSVPDGENGKE